MKVKVQSIHFDADQRLLDLIDQKMVKIEKLEPKATDLQVFLRLYASNGGIHEKVTEIKVNLPGKIIFSKEHSGSFEESFEGALDNVLTQIKKHKEKQRV